MFLKKKKHTDEEVKGLPFSMMRKPNFLVSSMTCCSAFWAWSLASASLLSVKFLDFAVVVGCYRVLQGVTGCRRVLQGVTYSPRMSTDLLSSSINSLRFLNVPQSLSDISLSE